MVPSHPNHIVEFLRFVGIDAQVQQDGNQEPIISVHTAQFDAKRAWIERWFTVIVQAEAITYLRERARGTGGNRSDQA